MNTGTLSNLEPFNAATTSRYNGSPMDPGSFVLSKYSLLNSIRDCIDQGSLAQNGLYRRTFNNPDLLALFCIR